MIYSAFRLLFPRLPRNKVKAAIVSLIIVVMIIIIVGVVVVNIAALTSFLGRREKR
jgi:hypothetical protein